MERNEKLEMLTALVGELGFSCDDVVNYWKARGKLEAKQSQSLIPAGTEEASQDQNSAKVIPGMFVYVDGLISSEIIEGRQIKAIVGSVDGSDVLAVCLQEACLPWSSDWLEAKETQTMTDGRDATHEILELSRKKRQNAQAAQWCYNYAQNGVKQGEAFLPSLTELKKLFVNKAKINVSLEMLRKVLGVDLFNDWYWSSTEYGKCYAWLLRMTDGYSCGSSKRFANYVRPVIAIKL